jgi:hypothetical protein
MRARVWDGLPIRIERAGSAGNSTNWFICRYVTVQCIIGVCPAYSALRCRIRWLHQVDWSWVVIDISANLNGMVQIGP